jgi:hypothetical protein
MPSKREKLSSEELSPELVNAYFQTFFGRTDLYAVQRYDGSYQCIKRPLTLPLLQAHLVGKITLGVYALDDHSLARWLCLDADDESAWQALRRVAADLEVQEVPCYRELSRRGGHLWLFLSPTQGKTTRLFGKGIIGAYQLQEVELYPKQDQLNTGPGSLVKAPFGVHQKSQMRYPFVDAENRFLAPTVEEHLARLCPPKTVPRAFFERLVQRGEEFEAARRQPTTHGPDTHPSRHLSPDQVVSERLKASISVYEFVSRYVALTPQGRGFCPFHDDQQMSFGVNIHENFWHCFAGCGGGSIIDFWMKWREQHGEEGSFRATIKDLAHLLL